MRPHTFRGGSLVFGVFFTGVGLMFLQGDIEVWRTDWSWFWPTMFTLAGVLVIASVRSEFQRRRPAADPVDVTRDFDDDEV
jgi:hypothetical protein